MKRWSIRFVHPARVQIRDIELWWRRNRRASPALFRDELRAAQGDLETFPMLGSLYEDAPIPGIRRMLHVRTRYHLYYRIDEAQHTVWVLAVWHAERGREPKLTPP